MTRRKYADDDNMLRVRDLAAIFRVHKSTVHGWANVGVIPSTRTSGGDFRFLRDDVQRLLITHGMTADDADAAINHVVGVRLNQHILNITLRNATKK